MLRQASRVRAGKGLQGQQGNLNKTKKNKRSRQGGSKNVVTASGSNSNVVKNVQRVLFPVKTSRRLVYHDTVFVTSTSGVPATYVFSTNGLYDPNITGTGHQPAGFDQIMLYYNHYYVNRATIAATARCTTAGLYPTFVLSVNGSSTAITDLNELQEDGSSVRTRLGPTGIDTSMQTLKTTCNVAIWRSPLPSGFNPVPG